MRRGTGIDIIDVVKLIVYVILTAFTIALAVVLLDRGYKDVGISLLAGGITSALFLVQRLADDLLASGHAANQAATLKELSDQLDHLLERVQLIGSDIGSFRGRIGGSADERGIFQRHITQETLELVGHVDLNDHLEIDAMGLSLSQLIADHEKTLRGRDRVDMRLLIYDPDSPFFEASVLQEGREPGRIRAQIMDTIRKLDDIRRVRAEKKLEGHLEVRLFDGILTSTGMRINETWLFRPRYANEANNILFFFEPYDASSPNAFKIITSQFETLWTGSAKAKTTVSRSRLIKGLFVRSR